MYKNAKQWARVRDRIVFYGDSIRHVAESEGMSSNTVRKMLKHTHPPGYISIAQSRSKSIKPRNTASTDSSQSKTIKDKLLWMEWLYSIEQQSKSRANSSNTHSKLYDVLAPSTNSPRTRALAVLAKLDGFSIAQISKHLAIARNTARKYLSDFQLGGEVVLFKGKNRPLKSDDLELQKCIFSLLHEPPTLHGFNRTTWRIADLCEILRKSGHSACDAVVRTIIKDAGYRWKSARVVLTSTDPEYREKYQHIQDILSGLKDDERFFSIDEFGPFAVKAKAGRVLVEPGDQPTVPQWQKSKGWLILTAAFELSRNQVTHFYSKAKNTEEMKRMTDVLIRQ
ncbi:MAG: helix-turn-helix domain-containing protein [Methylotenera sp.]